MLNDMKKTIKKKITLPTSRKQNIYGRLKTVDCGHKASVRQHIQYKLNIIASHNFQL